MKLIRQGMVAAAYFATGWLGYRIPDIGPGATVIWLPMGVAVAAMLRLGLEVWPAVYFGAFLVALSISHSVLISLGIAVGHTFAPALTVTLLRRWKFNSGFDRHQDVRLFVGAAATGMLVAALAGPITVYLGGLLSAPNFGFHVFTWWMGDLMGTLVLTPILVGTTARSLRALRPALREALVWCVVAAPVLWLAFGQRYPQVGDSLPLAFLTLPLVAWASLRFGVVGAGISSLACSLAGMVSTALNRGTFHVADGNLTLLLLWAYILTCVLMGLLIASLQAERLNAEVTLRGNEEKLRGLFNLSPLGIALTDMSGRFVEFNESFRRICGYSADELTALDYWALTPMKYESEERQQLESLRHTGYYGPYQKEYVRKTGEPVPLQLMGMLVTGHDGQQYIWSIAEDISERKRTEKELEQHRQHLAVLVEERTAELVQARDEARRADRAKTTFLANMSHELRTPMHGVLGMIDAARRHMTDEKGLEHLYKARLSAHRLLDVLNDILDISKIEAARLSLESIPLQLDAVQDNVRTLLGHRADDKGLVLSFEFDGELLRRPLRGDPLRLGQVLINLVGNAIKFSEHGVIYVRARVLEETPSDLLLRFEVEDQGIGINPGDQQRLFTAFEQADGSMTRKYGGTGLGLAICKQLVLMMHGEMGVNSTPGNGSTFWFTTRLEKNGHVGEFAKPAENQVLAELRLRRDYRGCRILLVEDEPIAQEISLDLLREVGLEVALAEDGERAVVLARTHRYDLILMDMQMPKMNGIDAANAIRKDSLNISTPILAMTANAFDQDRQLCMEAGMNDFITKPDSLEVLFDAVLRWLEVGQLNQVVKPDSEVN